MTKKRYLVTGPRPIVGFTTGQIVELDLTAELEKHLVDAGHIKPAPSQPKKASTEREHD